MTLRVAKMADCIGAALGRNWTHRFIFYIGADGDGDAFCVRHKVEKALGIMHWSRWRIARLNIDASADPDEHCSGQTTDGWVADFTFRAMRDNYQAARTLICVDELLGVSSGLQRILEAGKTGCPIRQSQYAVLRPEYARQVDGQVYCVCDMKYGDGIVSNKACTDSYAAQPGESVTPLDRKLAICGEKAKSYKFAFALLGRSSPRSESARAFCVGTRQRLRGKPPELESVTEHRIEEPGQCGMNGFTQTLELREVALEDVPEQLGLLSLAFT